MSTITTLPATTSSQISLPSGPAHQDTQTSSNVGSIKPFQIAHSTELHPFDKSEGLHPLSTTEHGRVMKALQTGATWLKSAITSLENPSGWTPKTKQLLSDLFPGALQKPSEAQAVKTQLTHTLDGVQKFIDNDALNIGSSASLPFGVSAISARSDDPHSPKDSGEMHISERWLRGSTDEDLAETVIHETSHIYANTDDNASTMVYDPPAFERYNDVGEFLGSSSTSSPQMPMSPPPAPGAGITFKNAVNDASTLAYATQVLADVSPFDSKHGPEAVSFLHAPQ